MFDALGHVASGAVTEIRAIDADRHGQPPLVGFFDSAEATVAEALRANDIGYNLYLGISGRRSDLFTRVQNRLLPCVNGGSNDDVVPPVHLLIDVDVDTARRRAATIAQGVKAGAIDDEIAVVEDLAAAIVADPLLAGVTPGVTFSGNGFGILIPVVAPADVDLAHVAVLMKAFGDLLRSRHVRPGCKIDSTFDLARISAMPGTVKRKGTAPALHRMVRLLQVPKGALELDTVVEAPDPGRRPKSSSSARGRRADPDQFPSIPTDLDIAPLLDDVGRRCPALRRIVEDVSELATEGRSGLLYHLTGLLRSVGLDDETATALVLWHDARCGRKFVGRRYPGWHDYLSHLLAGAAGYQGNHTIIRRLLGDDACSECDARSCG